MNKNPLFFDQLKISVLIKREKKEHDMLIHIILKQPASKRFSKALKEFSKSSVPDQQLAFSMLPKTRVKVSG